MTAVTVRELHAPYQYVVAEDAVSDVARLLEGEAQDDLVASAWYQGVRPGSRRSILELRGLGKAIWQGVDPRHYVNELRDEWNNH